MSTARIQKLNALLARVREKRGEPRLLRIPGAGAQESANTNITEREGPMLVSTSAAPPPALRSEAPRAPAAVEPPPPRPTSSIQPAALLESEAPEAKTEPPLQLKTPSSTVPPAAMPAVEPTARASTEVLPAAPVRVAPAPAVPFDSAVKVVSSPRIEAPKTFGELLELSLSLRPK